VSRFRDSPYPVAHFRWVEGAKAPTNCPEARVSGRRASLNLKAEVEREKAVQAIDVPREWTNCVVTLRVMSQFFHFLGASRGCADFRDPTTVFRLKEYLMHGSMESAECKLLSL